MVSLKICVITDNYPSQGHPTRGVFVYNLVQEWVAMGHQVTVICPEAGDVRSPSKLQAASARETAQVYYPKYFPFPRRRLIGRMSLVSLANWSFSRAVNKVIDNTRENFDIFYGHFLYPGGHAAAKVGLKHKIPLVVALGESRIDNWRQQMGSEQVRLLLRSIDVIAPVSQSISDYLTDELQIQSEKIRIVPNGVDNRMFYPMNKEEVRRKLKIPRDKYIVVFVGHFDDRKGYLRLLQAVESLEHAYLICLGKGPDQRDSNRILHQGLVKHSDLPKWLNVADAFVLPTRAEGASNAINEAAAVGLPLILGDIASVREQVPSDAALFVDPDNVVEIADAIEALRLNSELASSIGFRAVEFVKELTLKKRASRLINIITDTVRSRNAGHGS